MSISFGQATVDDIPAIGAMYDEARDWIRERGSDQWDPQRASKPPAHRTLANCVARGEVYMVREGGRNLGTLTLDDHADPDFWAADDEPGNALYVHLLVVVREAAGRHLGAAILDWAAQRAAEDGRSWLRLDAWRTSTDLHGYYVRHGFEHVRTVHAPHRGSGALFQRPVRS